MCFRFMFTPPFSGFDLEIMVLVKKEFFCRDEIDYLWFNLHTAVYLLFQFPKKIMKQILPI